MTERGILVEYLRRSYHAVDGLWFVKVEEASGFDAALDMDGRVWAILAKIQARKARELLEVRDNSPAELVRAFSLKLTADGYEFTAQVSEEGAQFTVTRCPWLEILHRTGREHLAQPIAEVMCPTEGTVWAQEFGGEYAFSLPEMACRGADACRLVFTRRP